MKKFAVVLTDSFKSTYKKQLLRKYPEFIEMEGLSTLPFAEQEKKKSSTAIEEDSTTMKRRSKKSVHFAAQIKVNIIPRVYDYSEEEIKQSWYTANEIGTIKAECAATVRKVVEYKYFDTEKECCRGLEYRTPDGARKRIRNKLRALEAVFTRQESLWKFDKTDQEEESTIIALAYRKYSVSCQEAAHKLGVEDERYIHLLTDWRRLNTNNQKRSSSPLSRRVALDGVKTSVGLEATRRSPRRTSIGSAAA